MKERTVKTHILAFALIGLIVLSNDSSSAQQSCGEIFVGRSSSHDSIRDTLEILNNFETNILKLYDTSGFKSDTEIIKASETTLGKPGELYRQALDILANDKIYVGIRLGADIRSKIARNGFLNSHQTGDSQGSVLGRDAIEASYANTDINQWKSLPDELKPKYAALYPKLGSELLSPESLDNYTGPDKYYFKLDRIRDRSTVTPGDSLNRFIYWVGLGLEAKTPESWDQMFIPWKHRFLLIPSLAEGLKEGRLGLPKILPITKYMRPDEYGNQSEIIGEGNLSPYKMRWTPNMDYLEVQIWGRLTLDDVAIFEYRTQPPSGPFLRELLRRGIEIRDRRPKEKL